MLTLFSRCFLAAVLAVSRIMACSMIEGFSKEKVGMEGCSDRHASCFFLLRKQGGALHLSPVHLRLDRGDRESSILNGRVSEWSSQIVCSFARLSQYARGTSSRYWRGRHVKKSMYRKSHLEIRLSTVVISVNKTASAACRDGLYQQIGCPQHDDGHTMSRVSDQSRAGSAQI